MTNKNLSRRKIRYAVVGLGHLAQVAILPAFKTARNSELVSIVSSDATKREELGKKYGLEQVYSYEEYEQALSQVDAAYIVLPNHLHKDWCARTARAGVHVLCEKPMAVTEKDCEAMIQSAEENKVKLMIAYRLHFEKGNLEAVQLASSGKPGKLRAFTSEFGQQVAEDNIRLTEPVENGADLFMTWACIASTQHAIYLGMNRLKLQHQAPAAKIQNSKRPGKWFLS